MKHFLKAALKIFKYLSLAFVIIYWVYLLIDDWIFIEKYPATDWLDADHLAIWFLYFVIYFLGFSVYYWAIVFTIILIYYKILPRLKQ